MAKPSAGSRNAAAAIAPAAWPPTVMKPSAGDRLALERAGDARGRACTWTCAYRACRTPGANNIEARFRAHVATAPALVRIASIASGEPASTSSLARAWASLEPQPTARAPAAQTSPASSGSPAPCASALREIVSASSATANGVADLDQPREPERVQPVAREQPESASPRAHAGAARRSAAGSPRRSPRPAARTPRAGRGAGAGRREHRRRGLGLGAAGRPRARLRDQAARPRAGAPRAASRPPAPSPCAASLTRSGAGSGRHAKAAAAAAMRALELLGLVGQRREPGLELRRRRVHAAREQLPAPACVGLQVAGRAHPRSRAPAVAEEDGEQARRRCTTWTG